MGSKKFLKRCTRNANKPSFNDIDRASHICWFMKQMNGLEMFGQFIIAVKANHKIKSGLLEQ
jgi:hypothetical protein